MRNRRSRTQARKGPPTRPQRPRATCKPRLEEPKNGPQPLQTPRGPAAGALPHGQAQIEGAAMKAQPLVDVGVAPQVRPSQAPAFIGVSETAFRVLGPTPLQGLPPTPARPVTLPGPRLAAHPDRGPNRPGPIPAPGRILSAGRRSRTAAGRPVRADQGRVTANAIRPRKGVLRGRNAGVSQ